MKPIAFFLLFPLFCLCSCNSNSYSCGMEKADSLINVFPDSAIIFLEQMADYIISAPKEVQMYYKLLTIKAKDKAYITHTSNKPILEILHYYQEKKNDKYLPEVLYYAGRVYRDLGDAPQALNYFLQAIDVSENSTDYNLLNKIYSQVGTLYLYQDIYDKAPMAFRKAYYYSVLAKDSVSMIYKLRDIGRAFTTQAEPDSAIYYYKKADELAKYIDNLHLRSVVNSELSGYYTELGRYEEAYQTMQIAFLRMKSRNMPSRYSTAAQYYMSINHLDSAEYYYKQLLNMDGCSYKQEAYYGLYKIVRAKGEIDEAFSFLDKYFIYADSVQSANQAEAIRKINALYDYQLQKKENSELRIETDQRKRLNIFLVTILIFSILLFIVYWKYHKQKERMKRIQQERIKKIQEEQYKLSLEQITRNKKEIEVLERKLRLSKITHDELSQNLLKAQKDLIERNNEQIEAIQRVQEQSELNLKRTDVYKRFQAVNKEGSEKVREADWKELRIVIDEAYNQFSSRLYELYPIKETEMKVCLLLKIELSPLQIATVTMRSKQAVSSIRKRLYKKLFNKEGSIEEFDNFIRHF